MHKTIVICNIIRFILIVKICFEEILIVLGKDAQTEHQVMLDKADHCLHIMQSALADRFALKAAVDELRDKGAEFYETSNPNTDLQIPNQKWLVKLRLSHKHCDAFMMCMDVELFRMRGGIVWVMPRDSESRQVHSTSGEEEVYVVEAGEKLYVNFFDIGLQKDAYTRRMHLRVAKVDKLTEDTAAALADKVQEVVSRCNSHVRVLDWDQTGRDRLALLAASSYDVTIWAGPYSKREAFCNKQKPGSAGQQKRTQQADWSSGSSRDWQGSHSGGGKRHESWSR